MAAVHAHLRVVGMHSGFCCLAAWCIESVLPYPLFNSSNLNFLDFSYILMIFLYIKNIF